MAEGGEKSLVHKCNFIGTQNVEQSQTDICLYFKRLEKMEINFTNFEWWLKII